LASAGATRTTERFAETDARTKIHELEARIRVLESRILELEPGAWVKLKTTPKWFKDTTGTSFGKIVSIDGPHATVEWKHHGSLNCTLRGQTTSVNMQFLTLVRPPLPYAVGDHVQVNPLLPHHMYPYERYLLDLTVHSIHEDLHFVDVIIANGWCDKRTYDMSTAFDFIKSL
jgi:hypothetical protein